MAVEKREKEKKSMIIVVPSCLKDANGARTRSDQFCCMVEGKVCAVQENSCEAWGGRVQQGVLEEGECRGEECLILVLAILVPEHLDSGVRNPRCYKGRGRRDVGYTGAGEGRHHHVMV